MTHRIVFSLLITVAFSSSLHSAGKEIEGERAPASSICPTPEEARAKMSVPDGYEVRCFAHEPMVQNPIAMTWDHRGRLWIVEAYEYPEGSELPAPFGGEAKDDQYHPMPKTGDKIPRDRVIILEDTDNNGEADKRTVFVEGLNLASAILCGDNGIYVGQQPHLIHFRDDDGDDKPDAWRVCLTGFGREDTHELVNSFTWGPDGWLYMTHGVFTNSKVRRPGQPESEGFKFDAGIGRARVMRAFQPAKGTSAEGQTGKSASPSASPWEFEVFADGTSNPWGCDYDAAGNFFVSACVIDHFFHMAPGGIYVRQGGAPENPYAYELLPSIVKHKHFRAAYAGIQIYQGGRYPADTHGHAFIGNIHDNAIHEEVLTPVGATFKCEPRRDFLRANDGWFRPVSTQTGPDGFLWVMDWCDKYPCYQNAKANPEGVDRERGRIWRVIHHPNLEGEIIDLNGQMSEEFENFSFSLDGSKLPKSNISQPIFSTQRIPTRLKTDLDLKKLVTTDLVKTLEHPNNWMRRMARRMLVERNDQAATLQEITRLPDNISSYAKFECACTLHCMEATTSALLDKLAANPDPVLQVWAARFTGEKWRLKLMERPSEIGATYLDELILGDESFSKARSRLGSLAKSADLSVRHAVAIALRQISGGCLTVNRPTKVLCDSRHGTGIIEGLAASIARDSWVEGGPPPNIDPVNPDDFAPGKTVNRVSADHLVSFAVWQALEPLAAERGPGIALRGLAHLGGKHPAFNFTLQRLCRRVSDEGNSEKLFGLLESLQVARAEPKLLATCLASVATGQEARVTMPDGDVSEILTDWRAYSNLEVRKHAQKLAVLWGDEVAVKEMIVELHDTTKPEKDRITVLQSLRKVRTDAVKKGLMPLLAPGTSTTLGVSAIRAAADLGGDDFIKPLLTQAASKDANIRVAAIEALGSRAAWTKAMLDAIAEGQVSASGFPAPVRRALATHKDKAIRDLAFKVLGAWQDSSDDVKSLIAAKKQACLTGEPDLANGKLIFAGTCMVCHEFHGGGQKVGPDLIGSGRSNLDAILANVIDPNQIIGNGYENFTVATKDGRTLAGRVVEDTPSHLKLLGAGGASQIVARDQIATLTNTKQSLMPMGFGALPDPMFRDLIWYILAPPEEGPLTQEKKELLIKGVETSEPTKPKGTNWRAIDWESVSLWNPEWKVNAPDFERTPVKFAEYHGKTNVLMMHPFPDKQTPASLERKIKIADGKSNLTFNVAADDRGDWQLRVMVNGQEIKKMPVDHEKPRWKTVEIDLSKFAGQEVTVRLEAHASDWYMEFAYWQGISLN